MKEVPPLLMSVEDQAALAKAVVRLERSNLAMRLADYAGQPINRLMKALPPAANEKIQAAVHFALAHSVKVVVRSLESKAPVQPSRLAPKLIAGLAGGVSGFAGLAALPIELPITTTNLLRAIADIARAEGESLASRDAQIACLEVFALGHRGRGIGSAAGYYALRTMLAKATGDAVSYLVQRGAAEEAAPVLMRFVTEIAARYGIIVSDRAAASAVPLLGALGGATVNWIFMDYFQDVARGHFTMRRLERVYGAETVQAWYHEVVRRLAEKQKNAG
jgi:hypothetical protein